MRVEAHTKKKHATCLLGLNRNEEVKLLLHDVVSTARRVLGEHHKVTLTLSWNYAIAVYNDPGVTLGDLRESVENLEDMHRISRRVLGGTHPHTEGIEESLRNSRAALLLRACETTPPPGSV